MPPKTRWIRFGDFLFKHRNKLFPIVLAIVFLGLKPATTYLGSYHLVLLKDYLAITIAACGLTVRGVVIGFAYIKRGGLNKEVYAEHLVTEGFFGICRNPLYVGNMLIYIGVFLMHGNPYVVVFGIWGYFMIYQSIIAAEEYFLRGKFGAAYESYCRDVPRWLMHVAKLRSATKGMRFNIRRVILKDYTTIANTTIALIVIKLIREWHVSTWEVFENSLLISGLAIILILKLTAAISYMKRRKFLKA
jgi:protein-S-isoprenylcysteine O-methyltransferase Ste14